MVEPRHSCVGSMLFGVVVGLLVSGCDSSKSSQQGSLSAEIPAPTPLLPPVQGWKPDPAVLERLEPYRDMAGYQIRAPKDWIANDQLSLAGGKTFLWHTARPGKNKATELCIMVIEAPKATSPRYEEFKKATLDAVFDGFLQSSTKSGFGHTAKQSGQVNGIPFARMEMTIHRNTPVPHDEQSAIYVGKDEHAIVVATFSDVQSHYAESAKLGVSAILTLRKRL
jgi:hypothetical protein